MGPLYYLPGESRSIKLERLKELGLGYAFEDKSLPSEVERGPIEVKGVVVADSHRVPEHKIGYFVDKQVWRKIPGVATDKGPCYVGIYRDDPPRPQDLVRLETLPGHFATLADGQAYLVPVARTVDPNAEQLDCFTKLPRTIGLDDNGDWTAAGIMPRYARLWEIACAYWDAKTGATEEEGRIVFDFAGEIDAAVSVLAANYRVGKAEVALCGLLHQQAVVRILDALIDWPTLELWLKKKLASAGSPTDSGPAATPPVTVTPSPTSTP